jgi:ubiquinone/menaquinone biosynthesis C-methylase UbiE
MTRLDEALARAAATYNAAADTYDDPANSFWARFGRRTVERLGLRAGDRVLDVCCGSGASAIPAAEAVGPGGSVRGIDLAANLLGLARAKAARRRLENVEFRAGDMMDARVPDASFDAVVCVFGIFFVPDMAAAARGLWRAVRPGGKLAITTWGPRFLEPANTAFWNSIREVRPDLYKGFNPWDRVSDPPGVDAMLREAGIEGAEVVAEAGQHPITSPEAWWAAVLGTGYRGTLDQLDAAARERVRAANLAFIRQSGIAAVEANVVFAIAPKPGAGGDGRRVPPPAAGDRGTGAPQRPER